MRPVCGAALLAASAAALGLAACESCHRPTVALAPDAAPAATLAGDGESIPPDEPAVIAETARVTASGVREAFAKRPPARRDAHAKAIGCVKARVTVLALAPELRVGVFREPRSYFAWIRYSNGNGTPQPDTVPDGRGMAIKLMGVPGAKILDAERDAATQDFLMINHPVFFVDTAANYATFSKELHDGDVLKYFAGIRSPRTWHLDAIKVVEGILAQRVVNPLETRYFSMSPYLFGDRPVKFSARPCAVHAGAYQATSSPTFLADNMEKNLATGSGCFDLLVQFRTDPDRMPVENPMREWSEHDSPFLPLARIEIPPQTFRSPEQAAFCENLSFTPWHALPEHRPLGGINRLRRVVYETISSVRHELNQVPPAEPTAGREFLPPAK